MLQQSPTLSAIGAVAARASALTGPAIRVAWPAARSRSRLASWARPTCTRRCWSPDPIARRAAHTTRRSSCAPSADSAACDPSTGAVPSPTVVVAAVSSLPTSSSRVLPHHRTVNLHPHVKVKECSARCVGGGVGAAARAVPGRLATPRRSRCEALVVRQSGTRAPRRRCRRVVR